MMAEIKLVVDGVIKKVIGAYTVINGEIKRLLWQSVVNGKIEDFINYTKIINQTIQIPEDTSQSRTYSFTVDNLVSVESIKVDTGKVSYAVDGNKINIICTDGSARSEYSSTRYSKYVTDSLSQTLENGTVPIFDLNLTYNKNDYSGKLSKDGVPTQRSKYIQTGASKSATGSQHFNLTFTNGSITGGSVPQSLSYSEGGYTGTLSLIHDTQYTSLTEALENLMATSYTGAFGFTLNYGGTVKQEDKEMVIWDQKYDGTVYSGGYYYYYKYNVDISYKVLSN